MTEDTDGMHEIYDSIRTVVDLDFRKRRIPAGTEGTIVEVYRDPEGYAVDLAIPCPELVGDYAYENITLTPDQFVVTRPYSESNSELQS
jgi:hypothetical protein